MREAFAGDNVVEDDFVAAKAAIVDDQTAKDRNVALPGWGSWGGHSAPPPRYACALSIACALSFRAFLLRAFVAAIVTCHHLLTIRCSHSGQ